MKKLLVLLALCLPLPAFAEHRTGSCKAEEPAMTQSNHALDADSLRANIRGKIQRLARREQCLKNYDVGLPDYGLFYRYEPSSATLVPIQSDAQP